MYSQSSIEHRVKNEINLVQDLMPILMLDMMAKMEKGQRATKSKKNYNELSELMADMGFSMCRSLGRLIKGRGDKFKPYRRCDLSPVA